MARPRVFRTESVGCQIAAPDLAPASVRWVHDRILHWPLSRRSFQVDPDDGQRMETRHGLGYAWELLVHAHKGANVASDATSIVAMSGAMLAA